MNTIFSLVPNSVSTCVSKRVRDFKVVEGSAENQDITIDEKVDNQGRLALAIASSVQGNPRLTIAITIEENFLKKAEVLNLLRSIGILNQNLEEVYVASPDVIPSLRNLKVNQVFIVKPELKAEFEKVNDPLWECVGKRANPNGGEILLFRYPPKFNSEKVGSLLKIALEIAKKSSKDGGFINLPGLIDLLEKNKKELKTEKLTDKQFEDLRLLFFPAVGPLPSNFRVLDDNTEDFTWKLGFRQRHDQDGHLQFIGVPNVAAFNANWENLLRSDEKFKSLPESIKNEISNYKVVESEGVLLPGPFVLNSIANNVVSTTSTGAEFIHDQFAHALKRAHLIYQMIREGKIEQFRKWETDIRDQVNILFKKIDELKEKMPKEMLKLEALTWIIGARIDVLWSPSFATKDYFPALSIELIISTLHQDPLWSKSNGVPAGYSSEKDADELRNFYTENFLKNK